MTENPLIKDCSWNDGRTKGNIRYDPLGAASVVHLDHNRRPPLGRIRPSSFPRLRSLKSRGRNRLPSLSVRTGKSEPLGRHYKGHRERYVTDRGLHSDGRIHIPARSRIVPAFFFFYFSVCTTGFFLGGAGVFRRSKGIRSNRARDFPEQFARKLRARLPAGYR